MTYTFRKFASILSVLFLTAFVAFGQNTTGSIEGTVKDSKGAVVPGASVTVTGVNTAFNQTVVTNSNGVYRIERVPTGTVRVTVAPINGFAEANVEARVVIEKTTTQDVELGTTVGAVVNVTSDPLGVVVDTTDSKLQTNITSELIEKLPTGTSFSSVLKVAPSTNYSSLTGGYSVDGASKAENAFVLDGQEITSYRYGTLDGVNNIPTALVKEVQVKTSGFEAEHGGASGGVVVISTKSGSNEMHGEFGAQFLSQKMQPANKFGTSWFQDWDYDGDGRVIDAVQVPYAIQQPKDSGLDFYPTASLGGAFIKDHLWYYGIYSPQIFTRERNVDYYLPIYTTGYVLTRNPAYNSETYTYKNRYEYAQGRLDYAFLRNFNGFTSYLWNPEIIEGSFPQSSISQASPGTQFPYTETGAALAALKGGRVNSNVFNTQLNWTPNTWFALTGRFGYGFVNDKGGSYAPNDYPRIICGGSASDPTYADGSNGCLYYGWQSSLSDTGATFAEVSKRRTFNIDANFFFNGFGRHAVKVGYEYAKLSSFLDEAPLNRYYHRPGPVSSSINSLYLNDYCTANPCIGYGYNLQYGEGGQASNRVQVLYAQDKWQIHRLTLNLGIRAENENLPAYNTSNANSVAIPINIPWDRKIVPRLGASYDLFGNGKTRIFGSYGWFTDRMKFELPIGSFGGAFYTRSFYPLIPGHPEYQYYNASVVFGSWDFPIGGGSPATAGGLAQLQQDFRIPSNLTPETYESLVGFPIVGVDPDLKPFKQEEITVGFETELTRQWVLSSRFTRKNLLETVEDIGYEDNGLNEYYTIGNPGKGVAQAQREAFGYISDVTAKRLYNAFEISILRRFADNWYFSANYTRSSLKGNTSGLANSDYWDGGSADGSSATRASPGVNRFFDWATHGYTAQGDLDYGVLGTDRPNVFKAYGGYTWDWWGSKTNATELSFFTTAMSGTPQTSVVDLGVPLVYLKRGDLGRTPTLTQTDFTLSHTYRFGRDNKYKVVGDITVFNAFNENAVTAIDPRRWLDSAPDYTLLLPSGFPSVNSYDQIVYIQNAIINGEAGPLIESYTNIPGNANSRLGQATSFQGSRSIRFGFRFVF